MQHGTSLTTSTAGHAAPSLAGHLGLQQAASDDYGARKCQGKTRAGQCEVHDIQRACCQEPLLALQQVLSCHIVVHPADTAADIASATVSTAAAAEKAHRAV